MVIGFSLMIILPKIKHLLKFTLPIFFITVILEVWMVNRLSSQGLQIQKIQAAEANLRLENQRLESQISQAASLKSLEEKSVQLGFGEIKNLKYLTYPALASNF